MAHSLSLLRLIRVRSSTTSLASFIPPPRTHLSGAFEPLKTSVVRIFESSSGRFTRPLTIHWKLYTQRWLHMTKSYTSGHEFNMGRLLGVSAVLGSFFLRPHFAQCIDDVEGYPSSADKHSIGMLGESETGDKQHDFMIVAKKLMVPIALLLIVWMNWNSPVVLGVKVIITLLSTKPSPFSVYVFIDQLQQQYRYRHPILHKFKSLYAKKVEVDDYTVFCIAKVEIGGQKYTLLGIMGGWWVFERTSLQSALSGFRSRTRQLLETAVSSEV